MDGQSKFLYNYQEILQHEKASRLTHPQPVESYHPADRLCKIHTGSVKVNLCGQCCGCGACSSPRFDTVKSISMF